MHLGSIYLVVNNFEESIAFYEKLLKIPLTSENNGRFGSFVFEGHCISILNGHFDIENPDKIVNKGKLDNWLEDLQSRALAANTHKFVFNFWVEDLKWEYERIKNLNITQNMSGMKYVCYVAPYYHFHLTDPDGNLIEVTGSYTPEDDEFVNLG